MCWQLKMLNLMDHMLKGITVTSTNRYLASPNILGPLQQPSARHSSISQQPSARHSSISQQPSARHSSISQQPSARHSSISQQPSARHHLCPEPYWMWPPSFAQIPLSIQPSVRCLFMLSHIPSIHVCHRRERGMVTLDAWYAGSGKSLPSRSAINPNSAGSKRIWCGFATERCWNSILTPCPCCTLQVLKTWACPTENLSKVTDILLSLSPGWLGLIVIRI